MSDLPLTAENIIRDIGSFKTDLLAEEKKFRPEPIGEPPRYFTTAEIKSICSVIPNIRSPIAEVSRDLRKAFLWNSLIPYLRKVKLVPTVKAFNEYKQFIKTKYLTSEAPAGTPVGFSAAAATSSQLAQQTFNSFKVSGFSKNMTSGIKGFTEILTAQKDIKKKYSSIYFHNNVSIDDIIINKRKEFVCISVKNVIKNHVIESAASLFPDGIFPFWYYLFSQTAGRDRPLPTMNGYLLRLVLDLDVLYKYRITPKMVASTISRDSSLNCVYSPLMRIPADSSDTAPVLNTDKNTPEDQENMVSVVYIDVYPVNETIIHDKLSDSVLSPVNKELVYLVNIVLPKLIEMQIQGVFGISEVEPIRIKILYSLMSELEMSRYLEGYDDYKFIRLNRKYMRNNGIMIEHVENLLDAAGYVNHRRLNPKEFPDFLDFDLIVKTLGDELPARSDGPGGIIDTINQKINEEIKVESAYRREQKANRLKSDNPQDIKIYRDVPKLLAASELIYMETVGSNFSELFRINGVDYSRSYVNNMHEIAKYLGMEAACNYQLKTQQTMVKANDAYIDSRHSHLLANYMTSLGVIVPLTAKGITAYKLGAAAVAAFSDPLTAFKKAALYGSTDKMINTSSRMIAGLPVHQGTGIVETPVDESKVRETLRRRQIEGKKQISTSVSAKIIKALEEIDDLDPETPFNLPTVSAIPPLPPNPLTPAQMFTLPEILTAPSKINEVKMSEIPNLNDIILPPMLSREMNMVTANVKETGIMDCNPVNETIIPQETTVSSIQPTVNTDSIPIDISYQKDLPNKMNVSGQDTVPELTKVIEDTSFLDSILG